MAALSNSYVAPARHNNSGVVSPHASRVAKFINSATSRAVFSPLYFIQSVAQALIMAFDGNLQRIEADPQTKNKAYIVKLSPGKLAFRVMESERRDVCQPSN